MLMRNDCWASPEEEKGMTQHSVYTSETFCSLPSVCVAGSPCSKHRKPNIKYKKNRWYNKRAVWSHGKDKRGRNRNIKTSSIICWDVQERGFSVCLVNWHNVSLVSMRSTEVAACTDTMVTAGILGRSNMSLASRTHINTLNSNIGGL